ncbi:lytic transglycosylase domain-containing protein [Thiolapillus sp.]
MLTAGRLFFSGMLAMFVVGQGHGAVCQTFEGHLFLASDEAAGKYRHLVKRCEEESTVSSLPTGNGGSRFPRFSAAQDQRPGGEEPHIVVQPGSMQGIARTNHRSLQFSRQIRFVSDLFNIDPLLLHAIAHVESRYNPHAVSPAGAIGLMQVMPATALRFGLENPETRLFDPMDNLLVSSLYLRALYRHFGNDLTLVLAAYNAGENAVIRHGRKVPPYRETREYVRKVMDYYLQLRSA